MGRNIFNNNGLPQEKKKNDDENLNCGGIYE